MAGGKKLTLGSLFDGSGGFPLGGLLAGIEPVWSSEIEPFPVLVTHKRMPQVKHYGDVSQLSGAELEPVDIITFGSPCQDLSIAGKRAGIQEGARSSLFFQAIRIIREMREATNGEKPRYCVWENVPGAFSSHEGEDFRAVLEAVIGVKEEGVQVPAPENHRWPKADVYLGDGWSVAYRVFDAQYWGVPQRRARIYLVADFAGASAGEVLFKSEGLSGYTPQGFRSWEGAAGGAEEGAGASGTEPDRRGEAYCLNPQGNSGVGVTHEQTNALVAQDHGNHPAVLQAAGFSTEHSAQSRSIGYEEETAPTLRAGVVPAALSIESHPADGRVCIRKDDKCQTLCGRAGTGGGNVPLVAEPMTLKIRSGCAGGGKGALVQYDKSATLGCHNDQTLFQPSNERLETYDVRFTSDGTKNARGNCYKTDISRCLDTGGEDPDSNHGGVCIVEAEPTYTLQGSMIGRTEQNGPQGEGVNEDVCFTLNCSDRHAVAAPAQDKATYCATTGSFMTVEREKTNTLMARDYKDPQIINDAPNQEPTYIVRRLTPVECARLQGFPDWWCSDLAILNPNEGALVFWMEVWATWNKLNGRKPKTEAQVRKWLANPHSDSAEYKLWGNGISLPIVFFVLSGIIWAASRGD